MSCITIERSTPEARLRRLDAEFYTSPLRASTASMLSNGMEWLSLKAVGGDATSGGTPQGHDLRTGDVEFITIDGISPLWLDSSRSKLVTAEHSAKELLRVQLAEGDIVVTIKRRICQAAVVGPEQAGAVVNQDVAVFAAHGRTRARGHRRVSCQRCGSKSGPVDPNGADQPVLERYQPE